MKKMQKVINNKLTVKQVKRIKKLKFKAAARDIADEYEVHPQTIYKIWDNTNWAWVN